MSLDSIKFRVAKIDFGGPSRPGFAAARMQPAVLSWIDDETNKLAQAAGAGYETRPAYATGGKGRGRGVVVTGTFESILDNARNQTLMRVLGGGRGLVKYVSKAGRESWITQKQYDNYTRRRG